MCVTLLALTAACGYQKTYPEVDTAPPDAPREPFRTSVSTPREVREEIEILISSFVQLNEKECDLWLACNSSFPPALEATAYLTGVWESWGPRYKLAASIRRIVEIGPAAVPVLCEHLDDLRKTGLHFEHPHSGIGGTWFGE